MSERGSGDVMKALKRELLDLKTYTCRFNGHYPVGACAVVVAYRKSQAADMLRKHLASIGLDQEVLGCNMIEVDQSKANVMVVLDGDY